MGKYIMALDQGTTSSRCILFDKKGNMCSVAQKEYKQYYPKPGWVEHDPKEIWSSQISVATEAMSKIGVDAEDIHAIGITNQRETTIVWDKKTGEPVYPAIVWQCRRTADMIEKMEKDGMSELVRKKTGLIPDAYFSGTKLKWILDHVEGARERAQNGELLFGTVDTWLIWKLTKGKVHVTDYTNASRTMLFDIHQRKWDKEILEYLNIPECMLPEVKPSSCIYGYTNENLIGGRIPIAGAAGDQQAALFGQCCFSEGEVKNTYGTGCFLLMNTGEQAVNSKNGLLTTIAASFENNVQYALEGSIFVAGAGVQWMRDEMDLFRDASETEKYADSVEDTNGVYVVPAFTGLGAPYWNPYARGTIVGLTRGCKKEHFVRAVLEAMAYQTYDILKIMEKESSVDIVSLKVDGGASKNNFLMQFQADVLGCKVIRPAVIETTALGAALLAGLAVGVWKNMDEIRRVWQVDLSLVPQMSEQEREKAMVGWHRAVRRSMRWAAEED